MKSDLLFFLIIVSAIVSVLYLVWKKAEVQDTERRLLHYILLHLLVALNVVLLLGGLAADMLIGREGTVNWLLDSPMTIGVVDIVLGIWLLGVAGTLVWCLIQHGRDVLRYGSRSMVPGNVEEICYRIASDMGLSKGKVKVWQVYGLDTTELGGWFRPVIYLPKEDYDEETLTNIITHELIHFIYGDRWFRELGMLVLCLYWFNPIAWKMIHQLKLWDEYHCDYQVCCCSHIDRASYIRTLCNMVLDVQSKSLLNPCFAEDGDDMVRRLEYIMKYKKINRKKWIATVMMMTAIFTALGSTTALAAGMTVNVAQNQVAIRTAEHYAEYENESDNDELVEYTMTADEVEGINIISDPGISTLAAYSINQTLKNDIYQSASFNASVGDSVTVYILADPTDVYFKAGIVQPNGVWRYVYDCEGITHTFEITQSGYHKVFVWNETSTSITVVGGYRITAAE